MQEHPYYITEYLALARELSYKKLNTLLHICGLLQGSIATHILQGKKKKTEMLEKLFHLATECSKTRSGMQRLCFQAMGFGNRTVFLLSFFFFLSPWLLSGMKMFSQFWKKAKPFPYIENTTATTCSLCIHFIACTSYHLGSSTRKLCVQSLWIMFSVLLGRSFHGKINIHTKQRQLSLEAEKNIINTM